MDTFIILAIVLAVFGVIGSFLPITPGPPLSAVAVLFIFLSKNSGETMSTTALVIWIAVAVIITVFDYILPGMLTKVTGGHKAAERGATIGLIAGLFLTPVGMVLGSFLGAFIGEYLFEKQGVGESLKAAAGSFIGFILTTGIKVIYSLTVLWVVLRRVLTLLT